MILLWPVLVATQYTPWLEYWDCMDPCYDTYRACTKPCGETFEVCRDVCQAVWTAAAQRKQLERHARFVRRLTGPGATWRVCRYVWLLISDPYDMYDDWIEICEERLPTDCLPSDADCDGDVDLYDLAILTRE